MKKGEGGITQSRSVGENCCFAEELQQLVENA